MENDQLNDFLVISIYKDIFIDIENEKIIQNFHNIKNCRGQFYTIQKSWIRHWKSGSELICRSRAPQPDGKETKPHQNDEQTKRRTRKS